MGVWADEMIKKSMIVKSVWAGGFVVHGWMAGRRTDRWTKIIK